MSARRLTPLKAVKTKCVICDQDHAEITREQIISAEMRKPLAAKENDPFPDIPGNSTVNFGTRWHKGGVFISDEAAANCATPEELNRAEARAEAELLRHVKAGLRPPGQSAPPWAQELPQGPTPEEAPPESLGRPRKARKKETVPRRLTCEQRMERAASAARARKKRAALRAAERAALGS